MCGSSSLSQRLQKPLRQLTLARAAVAEAAPARDGRKQRFCAVPQAVARIPDGKEEAIAILWHARPSGDHFAPALG